MPHILRNWTSVYIGHTHGPVSLADGISAERERDRDRERERQRETQRDYRVIIVIMMLIRSRVFSKERERSVEGIYNCIPVSLLYTSRKILRG